MHNAHDNQSAHEAGFRLATLIRRKRAAKGWSQQQAADEASRHRGGPEPVSREWWQRLERGRVYILPWEVDLVSKVLDVPMIELRQALGWEE